MRMTRWIHVLLACVAPALPALAGPVEAEQAALLAASGKAEPALVVAAWEAALADGVNAAALTGLGNARAMLGETGPAALAYERALAVDPGRHDARANLRLVRERAGVAEPEAGRLLEWARRAPLRLWLQAGSGGAALCLGLLLISFVASSGRLAIRFLAAVSACVAAAAGAGLAGYHLDRDAAVILVDDTPLRASPAPSLPAEGHLQAGERVHAVGAHGEFVAVRRGDGVAWVPAASVGKVWMP